MSLGQVVMIEIRDKLAVPRDELVALWTNAGLDAKILPKPRNAKDAFRKATPKTRKQTGLQLEPYNGSALTDDLVMAVILTNVSDSGYDISRNYEQRTVIALNKEDKIVYPYGKPWTYTEVDLVERVERDFQNHMDQVMDSVPVRYAVREQALKAKGFILKGGVYLMPHTSSDITAGLLQATQALNDYFPVGALQNRTFSVVYGESEKEKWQLKEHLDYYIKQDIEQNLRDLTHYVQNITKGPAGPRRSSSAMSKLMDMNLLITEYEGLLNASLSNLHAYVHMQEAIFQKVLEG
jgi:uncharacterized protein DUF6744